MGLPVRRSANLPDRRGIAPLAAGAMSANTAADAETNFRRPEKVRASRRGKLMRISLPLILLLSLYCTTFAQQPPCTIPASVITASLSSDHATAEGVAIHGTIFPGLPVFGVTSMIPTVETVPVPNLTPDDFVVEADHHPVRVLSTSFDRGPHRIAFVVENGKQMREAARRIEVAVISDILAKARPEDSFALLTARGPRVELRFGSSRDAIQKAVEELGNPPRGAPSGDGVLDGLLEVTNWFQPPQPGDSILVMARRLEDKHRASFSTVRAALASHQIRVFGFQLFRIYAETGNLIGGGCSYISDSNICSSGIDDGPYAQLLVLIAETGGVSEFEDTSPSKYFMAPGRSEELKKAGEEMYSAATGHYLLELESTSSYLWIRLKPSTLERFPWVSLTYPITSVACSQAAKLGSVPQTPCVVPVNVRMPNLSLLPQAAVDSLSRQWKEDLASNKYLMKGGQWNTFLQSENFLGNMKRALPIKKALVDELTTDAFVAHDDRGPVHIPSVVTYSGPHRIMFVVENYKKMPEGARKIESAVITGILSKARPEDSFALLTTRGPRVEIPFGSSRDTLHAAAKTLALPPPRGPGGEGVLDAVLEATTWFQPPQPGDSIFVMTAGLLQDTLHARPSKVRAALAAGRIRLFGLQFDGYDYRMVQLTGDSGGWATWPGFTREKLDDRVMDFVHDGEEMYMEATEHYLLQFDSFGARLTIGLAPATQSQHPWAEVQYPRSLPPCSNRTTATPAETKTTK